MMNEFFPSDWDSKRLNELGESYSGLKSKTKADFIDEGNAKFVTYRNINKNQFVDENDLSPVIVEESENQNAVIKGDVLFTGSSETPEEVAFSSVMNKSIEDLYLNSFSFGYRFNDDHKIEPEFYAYYFRGNFFRKAVFPLAQGSTRYNISRNELLKLHVPIPPVKEQHKIAAILSSVDEAIDKTEQIIEQTETVKKGLMQELLTKGIGHTEFKDTTVGKIPLNWKVKKLHEICTRIFVGIATSTTNHYAKDGVPIIRNQNILEDRLDTNDLLCITEEFSDKNENKKLKKGDVLTVRTGYPGISCVIPKSFEGTHTFTTLVTRPIQRMINSYYLSRYINSTEGKKFVSGGKAGGAQQNLNVSTLQNMQIAIPPIKEQEEIINILENIDSKINNDKYRLGKLNSLKQGLMQQLLTGKTRVKIDDSEEVPT